MKKNLFFVLCFSFLSFMVNAQNFAGSAIEPYKPFYKTPEEFKAHLNRLCNKKNKTERADSVYYLIASSYSYKTDTTNWLLVDSNNYQYTPTFKESSNTLLYNNGGTMVNYTRNSSTYDANDDNILSLQENWDTITGSWYNLSKTERVFINHLVQTKHDFDIYLGAFSPRYFYDYTYNGAGLITNTTYSAYTYQGIFMSMYRMLYTYDSNGNQLSYEQQYSSDSGISWIDNARYEYTYDANNNMLTWKTMFSNLGSPYVNENLYQQTYNSSNEITSDTTYNWSINTNDWESASLRTHQYDSNHNNTMINYFNKDSNGVFTQTHQNLYTYNSSGELETEVYKYVMGAGSFITSDSVFYVYDTHGNLATTYFRSQMITNWDYLNRYDYYYTGQLAGIKENEDGFIKTMLSPNPTTGIVAIEWETLNETNLSLNVFDVFGREVYQAKFPKSGRGNCQIDLNEFANGFYFINLKGEGFNKNLKVVKQ